LERSQIRELYTPRLEDPILVEGLSGFGNVGRITARTLVQQTQAKLFAEYYSPYFLTGNSQPPMDNVVAHYEICEDVLDYARKFDCSMIVTIGGIPVSSEKKDVYIAATSNELAADLMAKGGVVYGKGRIIGVTGLLLGLARERGLDGACLLGATSGQRVDKDAAANVFQFLMKTLGEETEGA
jgi:proteasome assembly chaperone (PAC2) family protein